MTAQSKLKQRPIRNPLQMEAMLRFVVDAAGLDFDADSFTPSHVVQILIEKGVEIADVEAKKVKTNVLSHAAIRRAKWAELRDAAELYLADSSARHRLERALEEVGE